MISGETSSAHPLSGKTVLFIRTSGLGRLQHYERLKGLGATLWCFEQVRKPAFDHVFNEWIIGDVFNEVAAVETIVGFIKDNAKRKPRGVLTFDEFGVAIAAATCEVLSMPGLPWEVMRQTRNKFNFRSMCVGAGLPSVPFRGINQIEDVASITSCSCGAALRHKTTARPVERVHTLDCAYMQFPVVFKPCEGGGSQFVQLVHSAEALTDVVANALRQTRENPSPHPSLEWVMTDPARPASLVQSPEATGEWHTQLRQTGDQASIQTPTGTLAHTQTQAQTQTRTQTRTRDKALGQGNIQTQAHTQPTPAPSPKSDKPMFMVEGMLEGVEVDCDVLVMDGQVVFLSISTNYAPQTPDYFMEMGGICPSDLPRQAQQSIVGVVRELFTSLSAIHEATTPHTAEAHMSAGANECSCDCDCECNQSCTLPVSVREGAAGTEITSRTRGLRSLNGCFHVELMYTAAGPVPIEINCRLGGAETHLMVHTAWGVSLSEGAVLLACGYDVGMHLDGLQVHMAVLACAEKDPQSASARLGVGRPALTPLNMTTLHTVSSLNLVPVRSGILRKQDIPLSVVKDAAYVASDLYFTVGAKVSVPPDGFQYLGWMVARESPTLTSEQNLKRLLDLCTFAMEMDGPSAQSNGTGTGSCLSFALREGTRCLHPLLDYEEKDVLEDRVSDRAESDPSRYVAPQDTVHATLNTSNRSLPGVQQAVRDISRVLSLKGADTLKARLAVCTSLADSRELLRARGSVFSDPVALKLNDCYCIRRCCHGNVMSETTDNRAYNQRV
ncbi:hypothetical protein SARC_02918 [Sphaeroforma arctica JP610]|uniref:ATP-grasp domain-containing protein n=1 Tax=Sphaeroforma arctica JP610 TaxID=667725 RepID=A0A0L0G7I1_9EUKA|nr:hypothetical protein SARC_02918 [Sphaeroforma arctica JP610]KNC84879.1 hypothetical protein SARC_02918 [Sphaeroforma arctica JP610]|eukprot:XP_014158781.1 hypothetical protein SARC_02918 [Sphaeroforma arctica JP610]